MWASPRFGQVSGRRAQLPCHAAQSQATSDESAHVPTRSAMSIRLRRSGQSASSVLREVQNQFQKARKQASAVASRPPQPMGWWLVAARRWAHRAGAPAIARPSGLQPPARRRNLVW
ncbi:MAG: hypothetical protein IPF71_16475 [Rhodoferax sp.]|nr:hypothetical protein [Rhodoferax sp.]